MSKYILGIIILLVSASFSTAEEAQNTSNCFTKEKIESLLNEGEFVGLSKGTTFDNKTHEIWLNTKNQMTVVSYNKLDKDSKFCIISMTNNQMYNGETIELLHKVLEKESPKL